MAGLTFAKINLRVRDLDAALTYARDVLGAEVLRERNTISFGDMALVRLGGLTIEIIAPDRADSPLARTIERRGEGIDSIGFRTDDVAGEAAQLESRGATMVQPVGDLGWLHPRNPLSLSIELLPERKAAASPAD